MTTISVAMTTYNGSKYIIEQLDSIRAQSLGVDEVVIRDDGSTDDTVEKIQNYITSHQLSTWSIKINEVNLGFADNFMLTISECSGDIIFLSDQDDVWYQNKVEETINLMDARPDIMCVASAYDICDSKGAIIDMKLRDEWKKGDGGLEFIELSHFLNGHSVRGASMCFRKKILSGEDAIGRIGLFGHDNLLGIYSILKGGMAFQNKILFKYRVHDSNTSSISAKKSPSLTAKNLAKRVKFLDSSIPVTRSLLRHDLLNEKQKKMIERRLYFVESRVDLIRNLSLRRIVMMLTYLKDYKANSPHGFIGGCRTFITDVSFSLMYTKWKSGA